MRFGDLRHALGLSADVSLKSFADREISFVAIDSRHVKADSVFVAIKGQSQDGHAYISQAIQNGARALVVEQSVSVPKDFEGFILKVPSTRVALAQVASVFFAHPTRDLICFGVTGTNGKTSITYLLETLLNSQGHKTGVVGTVNHHLGRRIWPSEMTTPDAVTLQQRLREFVNAGATAMAFEVSSHAIHQSRADCIDFDAAIFSNLTRDHLDYHGSMESYFAAKARLFTTLLPQSQKTQTYAVVNGDDGFGRQIQPGQRTRLFTYGAGPSDFQFELKKADLSGSQIELKALGQVYSAQIPVPGLHNVYNTVAAVAATHLVCGYSLNRLVDALAHFAGVPGRLQRVPNRKGIHIFVDYAHTPDALEKMTSSIRTLAKQTQDQGRVIVVFGCGGDRDAGKRPLMLRAALMYADRVVLTSDNPRSEDPNAIIADCLKGMTHAPDRSRVEVVVDRRQAIHKGIDLARAGDAVVIAGKGHEDYQIIGQQRFRFSDYEVAEEFVK